MQVLRCITARSRSHQYKFQKQWNQIYKCNLSTSCPEIKVSKSPVLIDEEVNIRVSGLKQGQKITIQTYMKEGDKTFGSCAHFTADCQGTVDTCRDQSQGGTFTGVEPMGLFWSARPTPGVKPGRLLKADIMSPYDVTIAVQDDFKEFDSLPWSDNLPCLTSCQLQRSYVTSGVQRFPIKINELQGTFFTPPGPGPFPAVLDMFGFSGGIIELRSALLASHGFASLTLGYVDLPGLPQREHHLDFNYFLKAFDWLASHPKVDPNRLGGVATCVGSGYQQFIASRRPAVKCLVMINGIARPFGSKQTIEGEVVDTITFQLDKVKIVDGFVSFREMFQPQDVTPTCPGWRHGAKILAIQCLDDQSINPFNLDNYKKHIPDEFKLNFSSITYPGAGHMLEPPYTPRCLASYNKISKMYLLWGGDEKHHSVAQKDSWQRIIFFLDQNLRKTNVNRTEAVTGL
ncbi:unnamed protein product [Lymnaea stagnalis]|uniref:Uncharacterized protein n=1 Tax=Lymnaea stagnalis TaxID=6523 RepID=A0AAV2HS59_LYMST